MAEVVFHEKIGQENGDLVEMRILRVPKSDAHPEGIRYALVYIHQNKRVVGYDNFEQKGHHKHIKNQEILYLFEDIDKLIQDFQEDVIKWKSEK